MLTSARPTLSAGKGRGTGAEIAAACKLAVGRWQWHLSSAEPAMRLLLAQMGALHGSAVVRHEQRRQRACARKLAGRLGVGGAQCCIQGQVSNPPLEGVPGMSLGRGGAFSESGVLVASRLIASASLRTSLMSDIVRCSKS